MWSWLLRYINHFNYSARERPTTEHDAYVCVQRQTQTHTRTCTLSGTHKQPLKHCTPVTSSVQWRPRSARRDASTSRSARERKAPHFLMAAQRVLVCADIHHACRVPWWLGNVCLQQPAAFATGVRFNRYAAGITCVRACVGVWVCLCATGSLALGHKHFRADSVGFIALGFVVVVVVVSSACII